MKKRLAAWSSFFYRITSTRNALLAFAGQLLFSIVIFPAAQAKFDITGKIGVPDLHFGFTPETLYRIFENYGPDGRKFYLMTEVFADSIYPLVYTLFDILLLSLVLRRMFPEGNPWRLLNLLPLSTLLFDYLENAFILKVLLNFPEHNDMAARLACMAQYGKWGSLGLCLALLLFLVGMLLRRRL